MRKFLLKIGLFIFFLLVVDQTVGAYLDRIPKLIQKGGVGRENFISNHVEDSILIFGSSRAWSHYNAQMITDSLGYTCYNCGEGGRDIINSYAKLKLVMERYEPKLVIYELTPFLDMLQGEADTHSLFLLKPFYERNGIDSIFWDIDPYEKYKMMSYLYRSNSKFLRNSFVYFTDRNTDPGVRGCSPSKTPFDSTKVQKDINKMYDSSVGYEYDIVKINYLRRFIEKAGKLNLLIVVSPLWYGQDSKVLEPVVEICRKKKVRLIDYSNDYRFVHNNDFFSDGLHLNAQGADEFTKILINDLKMLENKRGELLFE